jgi:hypothetical protein
VFREHTRELSKFGKFFFSQPASLRVMQFFKQKNWGMRICPAGLNEE